MHVGHESVGPLLLPHDESVSIGRSPKCGIRIAEPRLSAVLATLSPTEFGWVVTNGKRTRMTIESPFVLEASFAQGARALLQPADWLIRWDLDVLTEITVQYRASAGGLRVARDRSSEQTGNSFTALPAASSLKLTPDQRRRLGALFAYIIEDRDKPSNLEKAAAELSGDSVPSLRRAYVRTLEKVNRYRDEPIIHIEDLGYYLVVVAGILGPDDIPRSAG